jgi:hypothetical protein
MFAGFPPAAFVSRSRHVADLPQILIANLWGTWSVCIKARTGPSEDRRSKVRSSKREGYVSRRLTVLYTNRLLPLVITLPVPTQSSPSLGTFGMYVVTLYSAKTSLSLSKSLSV